MSGDLGDPVGPASPVDNGNGPFRRGGKGVSWRHTDGSFDAAVPDGWLQGRSIFGGLSAALCVSLANAIMDAADPKRIARWLRTINVHLFRPTLGGAVSGSGKVIRQGKSITFVRVSLLQDGEETVSATLVFHQPRAESLTIAATIPTDGVEVDQLMELPFLEGVTPEFTKHVAFRWHEGSFPFSGAEEARLIGYCRFRHQPLDNPLALLALLDVWPCPSLSRLKAPAPASTVSWTAHLIALPQDTDGWFRFEYTTIVGAGGMHSVAGSLYDRGGQLLGLTEQAVAVFA